MPHARFNPALAGLARPRQASGFSKCLFHLTLGLLLFWFPAFGYAQHPHQVEENQGSGWFTVIPDVSADGFAADIQVSAVTSEAQPFRVTYIQTRNLTKRRPESLQLRWFLVEVSATQRVLASGQVTAKRLPQEVAKALEEGKQADVETVAGRREYGLPLRACLETVRQAQAQRAYVVLVAEQAKFEDGENWQRTVTPESLLTGMGKLSKQSTTFYCPDQVCAARYDMSGNPLGYDCVSAGSASRGQLCQNNGTSCTNKICRPKQELCAVIPDLPECDDWWVIVQ